MKIKYRINAQPILVAVLVTTAGVQKGFCQMDTIVNVYFETNRHTLSENEIAKLQTVISSEYLIKQVAGYADSLGSPAYNLNLSRKRAEYVKNYLTGRQQRQSKFAVTFFGENHSSHQGDISRDRRVDIHLQHQLPAVHTGAREKNIDEITREPKEIQRRSFPAIYFVPDKPIIEPTSFAAVEELVRYVASFKNATFEVRGHVNLSRRQNVDAEFYMDMEKLSNERAKVVYNILLERGIPPERVTYRGMGNREMIYPNAKTETEMRKNMRVEIVVKE